MHRTVLSAAALALAGLTALPVAAAVAPVAARAALVTTQLPRNVRPIHYEVALTPDATRMTFAARVAITLDVVAPTASITLNAVDLAFSGATLVPAADGAPLQASTSVNAAAQTATFTFARLLARGRYTLSLDYTGVIGQQAAGLFALDYDSATGKQRALYTQFENSDARRMVPSWDEPAYKASFTLAATVPSAQMAVSNMPVASTSTLPDGRKRVTFGATPKMSTYLLFFALGEFERVTAMADGTEVGVITTKGGAAKAAFALDASSAILGEYNRYFGVRYPLPKLDNIAAPGRSQSFSAMENWGAIFTFEYAMLLDPAISTQFDKQEVFVTAAHEMAHQWFGNLVTMRWWDDLWLNEGFASWMESRTTARLHPEWHTELGAVGVREQAMERDAVATTHPVVQHVATVEQASQAFDDITYNKGASVIRMLEHYVGPQAWRNGVRAYMREHAYGNTVSDDLWRAIEKTARKPVTKIAHDFTLQPGVPLIRVDAATCKNGSTAVVLTQQEFSRDAQNRTALRWRVPVTLQAVGARRQVHALVAGGAANVRVPGCGAVIVNAGQSGYYRTLYAPGQFALLGASFASLAPIDQLGLLSDSWALGMAGMQPAAGFMGLANAATLAADPQVWGKIARIFSALHDHYAGDASRQQRFDTYAAQRLAPIFNQVGWNARDGENATVTNLRAELIETLGELNDDATVAEARRRYALPASEPGNAPALRKTLMVVVATHADAPTWDGLQRAALAEKSPMIKDQLYRSLASAADAALARRALALAMTDEPGATNSAAMLAQVAQRHPDMAFDFALAHLDQVNARVDTSSRSSFFPRLAASSADPATVAKLNAWAGANLAPGSRRDADTAIAGIRDRIKVRSGRLPEIDAWLSAR